MSVEQRNSEGADNNGGFVLHNLWPIPVYESALTSFNNKWLEYATNAEYERMHSGNGDITVDRYVLNKPELLDLQQQVLAHLDILMKKYMGAKPNAEFYLLNSWINRHYPGDHGQIHNHQNSLMSGCLYLGVNEDTGGICFYKGLSWTNLLPISVALEYDNFNHINAQYYKISPKQGSILLFPSHLEHSIEKNNSTETRYSLAFNFYVRGSFGREEYELTIK